MNKYDKEVLEDQEKRDSLILAETVIIYNIIRDLAHKQAMSVTNKAGDNKQYFTARAGRQEKFAKDLNKTLRPEYLKRDNFLKNVYAEEYRTSYFYAKYAVENKGISQGYKFKLPRYTKKQFTDALDYPLSKLMNTAKMKTGRSVDIEQLFNTIVSGVQQGKSLPNINKDLDINLGYRNTDGKWVADPTLRKGQQYKTQRILRTEIGRIRSDAQTDQWINQQDIVESNLTWVATLDDRVRRQSVEMDGDKANKEGLFTYPNGVVARQRQSGVARYDINDRCTTINVDPEYPPESRIQRDPETGKNSIQPYTKADDWAKANGLKKNRYGEYLFGEKPKRTIKPKTVKKPAIKKPVTTKKVTSKPEEIKKPITQKPVKYSSVEKNTLDSYGKEDYRQINKYLRDGSLKGATVGKQSMDTWVKTLDNSIAKNTLQKDTFVYRGVSGFKNPKDLIGSTINTKAFSSTSTSLSTAKSFSGIGNDSVVFKIKARKGTNFVNMKQFESGASTGESELLFGRGKSLNITGFKEEKVGNVVLRTILEGEYI
jgi:hypothetical protein